LVIFLQSAMMMMNFRFSSD